MHIHLSFWVAALVWGVSLTAGEPHPLGILYFMLAFFICLFVHEMGHAAAGRLLTREGMCICLSWMGGLSYSAAEEERCTRRAGALMTLAGPLVGVLFGLLLYGGIAVAMKSPQAAGALCWRMLQGQVPMEYAEACPPLLLLLGVYLFQITAGWNLLNLLPVYPLDGGALMHGLMAENHVAHSISLVITGLLAAVFFALGIWALALLMILIGYYNYRCILVHTE